MKHNPMGITQKHASTQYTKWKNLKWTCIASYTLQQMKLSQKGGQYKGQIKQQIISEKTKLVFPIEIR